MATVNIHEAKTHLSRLLARVAKGEEVIIDKGRLWFADDFDAPLPEEILAAFEGRSEDPS
jgi:hypothetical protein